MREFWVLYLIVLAVYLSDCLCIAPYTATCFVEYGWGKWKTSAPSFLIRNGKQRIFLLQSLPPLGSIVICEHSGSNASFRAATLNRKLASLRVRIVPLRFICNVLFLYIFVVLPVSLFIFQGVRWIRAGAILLSLMLLIVAELFTLRRRYFRRKTEWTGIVSMLVSPLNAIRACDYFWKHFIGEYHPLAVANALCDRRDFNAWASRYLRELTYPLETDNPTGGTERALIEDFLSSRVEFSQLLVPPAPEGSAKAYCPRCWTPYSFAAGTCSECPGIGLKAY